MSIECEHLNDWYQEDEFFLCSDCGMEMSPYLDHNSSVRYWKAKVERLEEIIRINGICDECGDGVQDWKDKDGNFTCGCKDES
jgi:hypothetical protein